MEKADTLRVAELTRFVSNFIDASGKSDTLDEVTIRDCIDKSILFLGQYRTTCY